MGVATKGRVKMDELPEGKGIARKARRLQISVSDKTWARLVTQAEEMGVSIPAYTTMMVAQSAMHSEMTRANMPDMFKGLAAEIGRRLPVEGEDE